MYHPRLQGSHYEMGNHYGNLLYKNGVRFDGLLALDENQLLSGLESEAICTSVYPEITEEIRGMADGLRISYNTFAAFLLQLGSFGEAYGCTCFCFQAGEDIIFARNHDMFTQFKSTTESCLYRPASGYTFVGQGDALIGKEDGLNEHGLAVGMTFVASGKTQPGLNFLMVVRYLLEKARNVQEGIHLLQELPLSTAQNIILADRSGAMAVVECCAQGIVVRKPEPGQPFIVATNQFIDSRMTALDERPEPDWYATQTRYHTVQHALAELLTQAQDPLQFAQDILSGRCGFVCQYNKALQFDTLWSLVVQPNDLTILRAEGNPKKAKFHEDTRLHWALRHKNM